MTSPYFSFFDQGGNEKSVLFFNVEEQKDQSLQTQQNERMVGYNMTCFENSDDTLVSRHFVEFESKYPTLLSAASVGYSPSLIETNNSLFLQRTKESSDRNAHLNKLDLQPRPFLTVPYLGRGAGDVEQENLILYPTLGDNVKPDNLYTQPPANVSVRESSFLDYRTVNYPKAVPCSSNSLSADNTIRMGVNCLNDVQPNAQMAAAAIEDLAIHGWVRGGLSSRID